MPKPPARKNDPVSNPIHGDGHITTGDATVTFENQPIACVGDTAKFQDTQEGAIKEGGACVMVNGKRIALVDDQTEKDGTIKKGASAIEVDEGKVCVFIGANVVVGKNVSFHCK